MKSLFKIRGLPFYLWLGAIWLFLWIFSALLNNSETLIPQAINEIWRTIYFVVINLVFFEYGLPHIQKRRKSILYAIFIGLLLISLQFILLSVVAVIWKYLGIQLHIFTPLRQVTIIPGTPLNYFIEDALFQVQAGLTSLFFFGISKLFFDNFKLKQAAQKLRLEKQEAELNYLKSQTNPHFLFNTLNNIYSLSRDKSDLAPESILRLSKILRFMLYETSGDFISVDKEMEIISDYVALEKMRYDDTLRVNFKQEIEDSTQLIPPLLLIPLVENAFKHGVSETKDEPFVYISASVNKQQLSFEIKNSTEHVDGTKNVKHNIGLSNLRRQLDLLFSEYSLTVEQNEAIFTATLKINLASHV